MSRVNDSREPVDAFADANANADDELDEESADLPLPATAGAEAAPASEPGSKAFYRSLGEYTSLAFVFPISMLLGFFFGRWLGGWFGSPGIGSAIGLVFGTGAAFLSLFRSLRRLERLGEAEDAEAEAAARKPHGR